MTPVALTVAGSDPSGGAGLQADLKTFHRHGVYGTAVLTLWTVQNTRGVSRVEPLPADAVLAQLDAVLGDVPPGAAKTGALGTAAVIAAVARRAAGFAFPLVVDPVMVSKHGHRLIDDGAVAAVRECLLPRAFLVTPNLREAALLTGAAVDDRAGMERAATAIAALGAKNVLIKGGGLPGDAVDLLWAGGEGHWLPGVRVGGGFQGAGCAYSAAVTANVALGLPLLPAVEAAKGFVARAIATAAKLGRGAVTPLNLWA